MVKNQENNGMEEIGLSNLHPNFIPVHTGKFPYKILIQNVDVMS